MSFDQPFEAFQLSDGTELKFFRPSLATMNGSADALGIDLWTIPENNFRTLLQAMHQPAKEATIQIMGIVVDLCSEQLDRLDMTEDDLFPLLIGEPILQAWLALARMTTLFIQDPKKRQLLREQLSGLHSVSDAIYEKASAATKSTVDSAVKSIRKAPAQKSIGTAGKSAGGSTKKNPTPTATANSS